MSIGQKFAVALILSSSLASLLPKGLSLKDDMLRIKKGNLTSMERSADRLIRKWAPKVLPKFSMENVMDFPHLILDLPADTVDEKVVKKAARKLMAQFHPDRKDTGDREKFGMVEQARENMLQEIRRASFLPKVRFKY